MATAAQDGVRGSAVRGAGFPGWEILRNMPRAGLALRPARAWGKEAGVHGCAPGLGSGAAAEAGMPAALFLAPPGPGRCWPWEGCWGLPSRAEVPWLSTLHCCRQAD